MKMVAGMSEVGLRASHGVARVHRGEAQRRGWRDVLWKAVEPPSAVRALAGRIRRRRFPSGGYGCAAGRVLVGCVLSLAVVLLPEVAWGQTPMEVLERQRDERDWKEVVDCKGAEKYLEAHPEGLHADEARECVAWAKVQGCEDSGAVERFLTDHPKGRHAAEARECLAWVEVKSCEDVEKVGEFQRRFPNGRYAAEAAECVALAVAQIQEALKGIARIEALFTGKAREALERERPEDAKSAIESLKEIRPEHPEVEKLETGLANLERVLDQRKKHERAIEALVGKVEGLLSERKHEQARAELAEGRKAGLSGKRLAALEERIDAEALVAEVRTLVGAGNVVEARARLAEARKGLLSGDARAGLEAAIEEAETTGRDAQVAEAEARLEQKEYGAAREALDRARALGLPEASFEELSERIRRRELEYRVSALREKCLGHLVKGKYAPALGCYRELLVLEPEDTEAQVMVEELPKDLAKE